MSEGTIVKGVGSIYDVADSFGNIFQCRARGIFRKEKITPSVGDKVVINDCVIEKILPRKNILKRPPCANIDFMGITLSAQLPVANMFLADKLTVIAYEMKIKPFVIINKIDIDNGGADRIHVHFMNSGIECVECSSIKSNGTDALKEMMGKGITVLAGQSGVGKTSLLNCLIPELSAETGELSLKLNSGRHTTRHVHLHSVDKGKLLMDTPGFSQLDIPDVQAPELKNYIPEFSQYTKKCAFNSCMHYHEDFCAVKSAVAEGRLSGERYDNYIKMINILEEKRKKYR